MVRGDASGFDEKFQTASIGARFVHVSVHPLTPCAPFLLEQLLRTPAEAQVIAADLRRGLGRVDLVPKAEDWIFAGALLAQPGHSPIGESFDILTSNGLTRQPPADAVLLSLDAEPATILRHRTLGNCIQVLGHDLRAAGPAMRAWIAVSFEPTARSIDDIRRDLVRLIGTAGAATGARFMILNRMSSNGREDISDYSPFDAPMGDTLATIAAKAMNLMLHDLAGEREIDIVDVDAVAADIGGSAHLPDGVHQSGTLQAILRAEILSLLAAV